jgi:UDP-2,3-diacylglucosamine pyrophosphatase LpxH
MKIRSLFISDTHFGCKYANSLYLLDFLEQIENTPEYIYLVGDIVDGWKLEKKWFWKDDYNKIFEKLINFSLSGSKIVWLTGNHDEFLRGYVYNLGSIEVLNECVHITADNRKLLIIHGDKFDCLMKVGNFIKFIGDNGYDYLLSLNQYITTIRKFLGFTSKWSLSSEVKTNVKSVSKYIGNFEQVVLEYTKEKGCSGIVCGHIHVPNITKIDEIDYYNCGDWVESCSAIIENFDGSMKLIHYKE